MARTHAIGVGDWIGALAARYGFSDWTQIWNHPSNAELRARRGTADLLMVGDLLQIPDAAMAGVDVATDVRAVFVLRRQDVLRVRITGVAPFIEELGRVPFELRVGDRSLCGSLAEDGQVLEMPLPRSVRSAEVFVMGRKLVDLAIGGLGPVDEHKGAFARLESLGYTAEIITTEGSSRQRVAEPIVTALLRFQRSHGLEPTGELDAATKRALEGEYGS